MLRDLLRPTSPEEELQALLSRLAQKGFPVTDWHSGGVARTLLEVYAQMASDLSELAVRIAEGGFLETAQGKWLDLVASSQYALQRAPAVYAKGIVRLTALPGFGPYTIQEGQLWFATASGLRFLGVSGGTLPQGGTLDVTIQAERTGSAYNVPTGTITTMITPLPGVTVTNPPGWLLVAGADEESDDRLRQRCRARWAELGYGATRMAYEFWALQAHPSVTRVKVRDQHPRGQGTVDVVIYGVGGIGAEVVAAVDAFIQQRRPITADVGIYAATPVPVSVVATVQVRSGFLATAQQRALENIQRYNQTVGIGETVYRAQIIELLMEPPGVVNVILSQPAEDVAITETQVADISATLTWQEV